MVIATPAKKKYSKQLMARHKAAHKKLEALAAEKIKGPLNHTAKLIAPKVGVSWHTVVNYIQGDCIDGFLTEAISEELQKLIFEL